MTNIQMVQKEVDGIEFYVSTDGKQSGMSISGLARLCGVSRPSLQDLLQKIQLNEGAGKKTPEMLKVLSSKDLYLQVDANNNAQVISADICAVIVEYYAFESKASNDTARFSFRKFSNKGMDLWIKEVTGYQKDQIPESKEIVSLLQQLLVKVDNLEKDSKEYKNLRGRTVKVFPALDKTLEELAVEEECLPEENPQNYTLVEWIVATKKGVILDNSSKHRLALLASETFKSVTGKEPKKECRQDKTTKKRTNSVSVYSYAEFPILQLAWNKLFNS
jgi:hypothetical protein